MKIAVVGAGFCGLAVTWHLLQDPKNSVVLIDQKGIGQGASGVPVGLLHYYAGPKASLSWMAHEAYPEAIKLLNIASDHLGQKVYKPSGILRPEIAGMDFSKAKDSPDTEWWDRKRCRSIIPELADNPGLFIRSGVVVDCPCYCQGLWRACLDLGATFESAHVSHAEELTGFDRVIFTVGSGQMQIAGLNAPQVSLIKGQALELEWQQKSPLAFALNSSVQFSQMHAETVFTGSTFERRWTQEGVDQDRCESEIRNKIAQMAPSFAHLPLRRVWSGFRAATSDKKPFICQSAPHVYCLGGMGSKGLLYHAWGAKQIKSSLSYPHN